MHGPEKEPEMEEEKSKKSGDDEKSKKSGDMMEDDAKADE